MDLLHILALALIQGLTEFLPISSSAHLILLPRLVDWPDQGLAFDVAVHLGTLSAVCIYFRRDLIAMAGAWWQSLYSRHIDENARLAWALILATLPAGLAGLMLNEFAENHLRSMMVIAASTLGFGLLLGWADSRATVERDESSLTWRDVAFIGCAQALALIPGTSRSGITITAGLMLGLKRQAAARFSFLLSIPIIAAAGLLETIKLVKQPVPVDWGAMALGAGVAALSAFLVIHYFLKLISRIRMLSFVIYRLILGAGLLYLSL